MVPERVRTLKEELLFIPGPVKISEKVAASLSRPLIDHRGPQFAALLEGIGRQLGPIFGTNNDIVLLGSSGTGGLDAAVTSVFSPGDKLLACPVGVFGQRFARIAEAAGCDVEILGTEAGHALDAGALAHRLSSDREGSIRGILLTHNETSTGVENDMAALSAALRDHPALRLVDSVSGLGASAFTMDAWGFDVVVSATQKVLAAPPGLALVAASERAWKAMGSSKGARFYFDLTKARNFAHDGQTPWTPPVSIVFALEAALQQYYAEGPEAVWQRHQRYARAIRAAIVALGLELFSSPGSHSRTVVAISFPKKLDVSRLLLSLRQNHGVVLSDGQQELKGKIIRMGTMGDLSQTDVIGALGALEMVLCEQEVDIQMGAGVGAALHVFHQADADSRHGAAQESDATEDAQTTAAFR